MNTEGWMAQLESESKGLKTAFERTANTIELKSRSINYQTVRNVITATTPAGSAPIDEAERVVVTLDTVTGANTIAKLELVADNPYARPYVRRIPYAGGARWMVTCKPKEPYSPTNIAFTVRTMVDGILSTAEVAS